jgi:hypothetical protein
MSRLPFGFPGRAARTYSEQGIPDDVADAWDELARALWQRPMRDLDGKPCPHVVTLSPEARREWVGWCHAHYAEQETDDFSDGLEGC